MCWQKKSRLVKAQRNAVLLALKGNGARMAERILAALFNPGLSIRLTRVAPSNGLDGDNLQGAMKGCRDSVAAWLLVDDRHPSITWHYAQRRGPWGVEIEIEDVEQHPTRNPDLGYLR
jgi:hypothetical protein